MRRLSIVAFITLFLIAALLPAEKNFIALAVTDGERLAMFSKPSVVRIIDGVAGTFYYAPPKWRSGKTYSMSSVDYSTAIPKFEEVKRLFPEHSEVNRLIQSSQQAIAEGKEKSNFTLWAMLATVLVILFFMVVITGVGVTILLIARKRSKAKGVSAGVSTFGASAGGVSSSRSPGAGGSAAGSSSAGGSAGTPAGSGAAQPSPSYGAATPSAESRGTAASSSSSASASSAAPGASGDQAFESISPIASNADKETIDLSRTIAIAPAIDTAPINYGSIKFVSGALAGQKFDISPDGACIGRDSTLSQIVIADGRISKRHVWIGVRDGCVTITDQGSRNGTFVNDPKSQRVTETVLNDGDTVILGESDVARFEYQK